MNIAYADKKMEKILTNPRLIVKTYGKNAERLMNRLSELHAAFSLEMIPNVPPPRRHKLSGNYDGCWGIDYSANRRIVVRPQGDFNPNNLSTIHHIKIVVLEDYH